MGRATTGSQSPNEATLAKVFALLADVMDKQRHAKALVLLSKAIRAAPKDAALLHCRGALYALQADELPSWKAAFDAPRKKLFKRAVKDYGAAIKLSPSCAEAHLNRGLAHYQLGDREGADADFTRALELGLEPVLALQAYSHRGAEGDIATVNRMRRARGIGNDWRPLKPQVRTLRGTAPSSATTKRP